MRKLGSAFALVCLTLLFSGCGSGGGGGDSPPATTTATVCTTCITSIVLDGTVTQITSQIIQEASGGTVSVGSGPLTGTNVSIPANSLPADTTVTVGQVTNSTLVPSDELVTDIGPSGTLLDPTKPAELKIKYDPQYLTDNNITDTSTLKVCAFDDNVATETLTPTNVDTSNNLVTANTSHFSNFAVLGYSKASLKGYYSFVNYFFDRNAIPLTAPSVGNVLPTPKGFLGNEFTIGFDGNGIWTEYDEVRNNDGVISIIPASSLCSGTYTVLPDGTLTVTTNITQTCGGGDITGQVLAGGSTVVVSSQSAGEIPDLNVGVQRINSSYTNASLTGTYSYVFITSDSQASQGVAPPVGNPLPALQGFSSDLGTITFDGSGNYTETDISSTNGVIANNNGSGTYSVASDGTMTTDGGGNGQLLAGGSAMVIRGYGNGSDPATIFLIKQQPGNFSNATLKGKYTLLDYGYDHTASQGLMPNPGQTLPPPNGFQGNLGIMTFDGSGNWTITGSFNSDGIVGAMTGITSGTYSVASDGTVTLTVGTDQFTGHVLADGSTFILAPTTAGQMSEIMVGLTR